MAKPTFWNLLFKDRRMIIVLLLGFSSGLPLALVGGTLQGWLTDAKLSVGTIGLFALAGLPYTCKFLWSPFLDRYALPFLGLRRGWGVLSQIGLALSLVALTTIDPATQTDLFAMMVIVIAFFSASQDIVLDAYRTEILTDETYGVGAGMYTTGYRLAMVVSGGAALSMAQRMSWNQVYVIMATLCLVGAITLLFSPEPQVARTLKTSGLRETVVRPFVEFFQRSGAMEILLFVMIYKLSTLMATALTTKFLLDLGYTKDVIGMANKTAGLVATILGTLVGGSMMIKMGMKRALFVFGIVQSLVGLTFYVMPHLAQLDPVWRDTSLVSVIFIDYFMMGLGTAAIMGFMMSVISKQFSGTQYALLSSLTAVTRVILTAHAGHIVEVIGWDLFFLSTIPLAIPGLLLLRHFDDWQKGSTVLKHGIGRFDLGMVITFMISLLALSSDPLWRWLDHKEAGDVVVLIGAIGIVGVVFAGLAKPYFTSVSLDKKPVQ
ncbi:MAG: AmpG family muropeptide MFS transporter [Bdellovibrionales bacterium]|nr:AmpG family muropeptide MFS transporter [Bdellovibrionales bacterium]